MIPTFTADYPLIPVAEYKHPNDSASITIDTKMDFGAYQYNKGTDYNKINETNNDFDIIINQNYLEIIPANPITYALYPIQITICNLLGETVIIENNLKTNKIDISGITNGFYIITIKYDNRIFSYKFIK